MSQNSDHLQNANLYKQEAHLRTLHKAVEIAYARGDALEPLDFVSIDMLHYLGKEELDFAATKLRMGAHTRVVDVGCGVGGPSRYMSKYYQCKVTGVEYQPEMANIARILNNIQKISDNEVKIECGDFTCMVPPADKFDVLMSQLAMLHIPNKSELYNNCSAFLRTGGKFFIEDYFLKETPPQVIKEILEEDISIPDGFLPTKEEYIQYLENSGLVVDEWIERTEQWVEFVWDRCEKYLIEHEVGGATQLPQLGHFYIQVAKIFCRADMCTS